MLKSILTTLSLLLTFVILPTTALAFHHRHGRQQPPPPPPVVAAACTKPINYGHQPLVDGAYDLAAARADLTGMKAKGIDCVRLAFYGTNADITKPLALLAKQLGLYVVVGNWGDPTDSDYAPAVLAFAAWAQANHIDQFSIGNEAEYNSSASPATVQNLLRTLACSVKVGYKGVVSYDTEPYQVGPDAWNTNSLGCIDKIGVNLYAAWDDFAATEQQYLAGHWYVSEYNVEMDENANISDADHASQLSAIIGKLKPYNVPKFYFAFAAGGAGTNPHWGLYQNGKLAQPKTAAVLGL